MPLIASALLALLPSVLDAAEAPGASRSRDAVLSFLGNEGFALTSGNRTVLFDALQVVGSAERGDLPEDVYARMLQRKPPFVRVPLLLVSHPHPDHHVPSVTSRFLLAHPETTLLGTREVVSTMEGEPDLRRFRGRLREVHLEPGKGTDVEHEGIQVRLIELRHLAFELYQVRVVAHLVRFGGVTVLHVGDAELSPERLDGLELPQEAIDVAILPYWVFTQPGARALIDTHIAPKRVVAMRLPQGGMEAAKEKIADAYPDVVVLTEPLKSVKL